MPRGGARINAGRKPGVSNRATAQKRAEIEASGLTPLDFMLAVLRDENKADDLRFEAAKAAAPYVHPKLAAIEHSNGIDGPFQIIISAADAEL